jgi:hypothetical protein
MTTECICATDTISTGLIYRPTIANQKSKKSVWNGLKALAGTIGDYAVEVYRYTIDQEPVISNGGPRVVIRQDRIDLV